MTEEFTVNPGESVSQALIRRLLALENRKLKLDDLPLAALQNKLAYDWLPDGSVLIQAGSLTADQFATSVGVMSAGDVWPTVRTTAVDGALFCQGQAISRTGFPALFAQISTLWGVGDGSTTFNIPDFRGRGLIGAGTGSGLTARALAALLGSEPSNMPDHTHVAAAGSFMETTFTVGLAADGGAQPSWYPNTWNPLTGTVNGGVTGKDNMPPSAVVNWQIKT